MVCVGISMCYWSVAVYIMFISKNNTIVILLLITFLLLYANFYDIHIGQLELFSPKQTECPFSNVMIEGKYASSRPANYSEVCKCDPACGGSDCDVCCQLPYNAQSGEYP